jgi:energy-converting hydrogenase Eha subunit A
VAISWLLEMRFVVSNSSSFTGVVVVGVVVVGVIIVGVVVVGVIIVGVVVGVVVALFVTFVPEDKVQERRNVKLMYRFLNLINSDL